jgi:hypothetical protein
MTDSDRAFVDIMTNNIRYWRSLQSGIATPSGRPKKIPWYLLVRCPKGHITVTNMRRPIGMRFRCGRHGYRQGTGTVKCERKVEIIEIPDMEQVVGISKEDADILHEAWKDKHT